MTEPPLHDLHIFMQQVTDEIASEYQRIYERSTEDAGTAGDQGEENWATILRDWLPQDFQIVTKGRLIGHDGTTSPQVDIIILKPSYPRKLLDKKLYLAGGVAAIFECKNTLRAEHIRSSCDRSAKFKALFEPREGSPYRELVSPMIYGVLAHSHTWKQPRSNPLDNIEKTLEQAHQDWSAHPRELLDIMCVADVGTWAKHASCVYLAEWHPNPSALSELFQASRGPTTAMICHSIYQEQQLSHFTAVGALLNSLINKLAWENPGMRDIADYFSKAQLGGNGKGTMKFWPISVYTESVKNQVLAGRATNGVPWDEWSFVLG